MRRAHEEWIEKLIASEFEGEPARMLGCCKEIASRMAKSFDDLELVKGHAICPAPWGKRGHWWCMDSSGEIVDPTAGQFVHGVFFL